MTKYLSKYGFTLTELLATISILSIVVILSFGVFFSGLKYSAKAKDDVSMQQEMNILLTSLTKFQETESKYEIITDANPKANKITLQSKNTLGQVIKTITFSNSNFNYSLYNYKDNSDTPYTNTYSVDTANPLFIKIVITNKSNPSQTYEIKTVISRL